MRVVQLHLRCTIWKVVCLSGQTRADQWLMLTMQKLHTPIHITLCLVNCWTAVYGEIKFKILSVERYHTVCVVSNNWHSMWYFIKSLYIAKETWCCEDIKLLFLCPRLLCPSDEESGGGDILIYPLSVRPSRYRYMVCPAISSYSFGATALIFCRMFIHIMEVCMSTGFWFSSNILKMTGSWT